MEELRAQWYGCHVCGELRRFPFEQNEDAPGCRCRPADRMSSPMRSDEPVEREREDLAAELPVG